MLERKIYTTTIKGWKVKVQGAPLNGGSELIKAIQFGYSIKAGKNFDLTLDYDLVCRTNDLCRFFDDYTEDKSLKIIDRKIEISWSYNSLLYLAALSNNTAALAYLKKKFKYEFEALPEFDAKKYRNLILSNCLNMALELGAKETAIFLIDNNAKTLYETLIKTRAISKGAEKETLSYPLN